MDLAPTPCTINARNGIQWFSISCDDLGSDLVAAREDLWPYELVLSGQAKARCWTQLLVDQHLIRGTDRLFLLVTYTCVYLLLNTMSWSSYNE
jgi:hypothetical protein